jgi:hypothetical protein
MPIIGGAASNLEKRIELEKLAKSFTPTHSI